MATGPLVAVAAWMTCVHPPDGQGIERDGQLGERQELLQLAGEVQDLSSKRVEHRALSEGIPQERERASAHVVVASRERPVEAKEVTSSQPVGQHRSGRAGAHDDVVENLCHDEPSLVSIARFCSGSGNQNKYFRLTTG